MAMLSFYYLALGVFFFSFSVWIGRGADERQRAKCTKEPFALEPINQIIGKELQINCGAIQAEKRTTTI